MNHMLWQLEIHAKPIIEHIHADTQYKICGHTHSLKLRAYINIQIKPVFRRLFFYQVHANIWVHLVFWKVLHYFHPQYIFFKNLFVVFWSTKFSKGTGCWFFQKHVGFKKWNGLSPKKSYNLWPPSEHQSAQINQSLEILGCLLGALL